VHALIKNIKSLVQVRDASVKHFDRLSAGSLGGEQMNELPSVENAYLIIRDGLIHAFGKMEDLSKEFDNVLHPAYEVIDATNKIVLPTWCDSHTHLVFAGWREKEFADRINGLSYEEIAKRGGGILNSAKLLHKTDENDLVESAYNRLLEIQKMGTGAVEIKSGYGLTLESELKMLRVIQKLKTLTNIRIKATFLGAHAIPDEYKNNKRGYIDLIVQKMLPQIADQHLADYCDVFCERNYFSKDETIEILEAAAKLGIKGKVHAEQLSHQGGIEAGVQASAISVDHLEFANDNDIELLKKSTTIPTILPGAALFLDLPRPPARNMIDAGLPLAIATDYNPGTSPSGNMNLMVALMCVQYQLTPEEAINAATVNGAVAMDLEHEVGSITIGKRANLILTKSIESYNSIPYRFGEDLIERVIIG
jgi:imidazolonepropionase